MISLRAVMGRIAAMPSRGRYVHSGPTMLFWNTPVLCAEPLKKKKKLDPQILKQREERKRKRLEKMIRRLEKNARQLKPVEELEVPMQLIDEQDTRQRTAVTVTPEEAERHGSLERQWAKYKLQEKLENYQQFDRLMAAQTKALDELRLESAELYSRAIELDQQLVPIKITGPVQTPPVAGYENPDGEYYDTTRKWD